MKRTTRTIKLPQPILVCTTCWGECGQCGGNGHRVLTDRIPASYDHNDHLPGGRIELPPTTRSSMFPKRLYALIIALTIAVLGAVYFLLNQ